MIWAFTGGRHGFSYLCLVKSSCLASIWAQYDMPCQVASSPSRSTPEEGQSSTWAFLWLHTHLSHTYSGTSL